MHVVEIESLRLSLKVDGAWRARNRDRARGRSRLVKAGCSPSAGEGSGLKSGARVSCSFLAKRLRSAAGLLHIHPLHAAWSASLLFSPSLLISRITRLR